MGSTAYSYRKEVKAKDAIKDYILHNTPRDLSNKGVYVFKLVDFRINKDKFTLLMENTEDPSHREVFCGRWFFEKYEDSSELFIRYEPLSEGFSSGYSMFKVWAEDILKKSAQVKSENSRAVDFVRWLEEGKADAKKWREEALLLEQNFLFEQQSLI